MKVSQVLSGQQLPLKPDLSWGAARVTCWWIILKKKESRHLLRCRLSKRTAERWAIWEIWSRVPFISSALWTHWHKSCSLCSGKPGATWRTQGVRCWVLCWLEGWRRAINTRDQRPGMILGGLGVPLAHWHVLGRGAAASKATRVLHPSSRRLQQGTSPNRQMSYQPALTRALHWASSVPFALPGCQKILFDSLRGLFPKGKTPTDPAGEARGRPKGYMKWKVILVDSVIPEHRELESRRVRNAEPAAGLARKLIIAGFVCIWKTCLWNQAI